MKKNSRKKKATSRCCLKEVKTKNPILTDDKVKESPALTWRE